MTTVKREELLEKFNLAQKKIETLKTENKELAKQFDTNGVYIDRYGELRNISESSFLLRTFKWVKSRFDDAQDLADEIGLKLTNIDDTYLGFTKNEWLADFKIAAQIVNNTEKINSLTKVYEACEKHLSEDDKMQLDFVNVDMSLVDEEDSE